MMIGGAGSKNLQGVQTIRSLAMQEQAGRDQPLGSLKIVVLVRELFAPKRRQQQHEDGQDLKPSKQH